MPVYRDLPNPGIEPASLMCPALAGGFFTIGATWEALRVNAATKIGLCPNSLRYEMAIT